MIQVNKNRDSTAASISLFITFRCSLPKLEVAKQPRGWVDDWRPGHGCGSVFLYVFLYYRIHGCCQL